MDYTKQGTTEARSSTKQTAGMRSLVLRIVRLAKAWLWTKAMRRYLKGRDFNSENGAGARETSSHPNQSIRVKFTTGEKAFLPIVSTSTLEQEGGISHSMITEDGAFISTQVQDKEANGTVGGVVGGSTILRVYALHLDPSGSLTLRPYSND